MAAPHGALPGPVTLIRESLVRAEHMLEPSTWPLPATSAEEEVFFGEVAKVPIVLAPITQARVRSVRSSEDCIINFCNESEVPVHAIWLDFNGNEVQYSVIEPKAQRRYRTFATHPWIIRETATKQRMMLGQRMVVFGQAGQEVKAVIKRPPSLPWSLGTHKFYPASFKKLVKTLLLSHHRLRGSDNNAYLLEDLHLENLSNSSFQKIDHLQSASDPIKTLKLKQGKQEREPLLPGHNSTVNEALNNCFHQVEPMCVCLEAICTYSGCYTSSLRSQASTSPSLASTSSTMVTVSSSSSAAMDEWHGPSSSATTTSNEDGRPGCSSMPPAACIECRPSTQQVAGHAASQAALQRLRTQQAQQDAQGRGEEEEVSSPRSILRASNKMFGWVVDKVAKVARPMSAPKPQELDSCRQGGTEGPSWRTDLMEMSELPTHLVLHIISLMAPKNVPQCVSWAAPEACPDILPALLESDPSTWPAPPPAIPLADAQ